MLLEFTLFSGEINLVGGKFGFVDGKLGFIGRNIEIVVPNPFEGALTAHAKKPYFAASETFPGVVAEQRKNIFLQETGSGKATHVRVTADLANTGRGLRNRN